jgi:hypothetical protein
MMTYAQKFMPAIFAATAILVLAGCGNSAPRGIYKADNDLVEMQLDFRKGGVVYVSVMGMETEGAYEMVEKNKVKIIANNENQILTIAEDGSIEGPLGMKLIKQK